MCVHIYIYISLWTILKLKLIIALGFQGGWVCFQNERERGKKNRVRGEKNILHTQQHGFDPITCWPLLLCIMLDWQANKYSLRQTSMVDIKIWNNWNGNFWEKQRITFGIIHTSELLAMENHFGHTNNSSALTAKKRHKEHSWGKPQFSQELKVLQGVIHLKILQRHFHKFRRTSSLNSTH